MSCMESNESCTVSQYVPANQNIRNAQGYFSLRHNRRWNQTMAFFSYVKSLFGTSHPANKMRIRSGCQDTEVTAAETTDEESSAYDCISSEQLEMEASPSCENVGSSLYLQDSPEGIYSSVLDTGRASVSHPTFVSKYESIENTLSPSSTKYSVNPRSESSLSSSLTIRCKQRVSLTSTDQESATVAYHAKSKTYREKKRKLLRRSLSTSSHYRCPPQSLASDHSTFSARDNSQTLSQRTAFDISPSSTIITGDSPSRENANERLLRITNHSNITDAVSSDARTTFNKNQENVCDVCKQSCIDQEESCAVCKKHLMNQKTLCDVCRKPYINHTELILISPGLLRSIKTKVKTRLRPNRKHTGRKPLYRKGSNLSDPVLSYRSTPSSDPSVSNILQAWTLEQTGYERPAETTDDEKKENTSVLGDTFSDNIREKLYELIMRLKTGSFYPSFGVSDENANVDYDDAVKVYQEKVLKHYIDNRHARQKTSAGQMSDNVNESENVSDARRSSQEAEESVASVKENPTEPLNEQIEALPELAEPTFDLAASLNRQQIHGKEIIGGSSGSDTKVYGEDVCGKPGQGYIDNRRRKSKGKMDVNKFKVNERAIKRVSDENVELEKTAKLERENIIQGEKHALTEPVTQESAQKLDVAQESAQKLDVTQESAQKLDVAQESAQKLDVEQESSPKQPIRQISAKEELVTDRHAQSLLHSRSQVFRSKSSMKETDHMWRILNNVIDDRIKTKLEETNKKRRQRSALGYTPRSFHREFDKRQTFSEQQRLKNKQDSRKQERKRSVQDVTKSVSSFFEKGGKSSDHPDLETSNYSNEISWFSASTEGHQDSPTDNQRLKLSDAQSVTKEYTETGTTSPLRPKEDIEQENITSPSNKYNMLDNAAVTNQELSEGTVSDVANAQKGEHIINAQESLLQMIYDKVLEPLGMRIVDDLEQYGQRKKLLKYTVPTVSGLYQPPEAKPLYLSEVLTALGFRTLRRRRSPRWIDEESDSESEEDSDTELSQWRDAQQHAFPKNIRQPGLLSYLRTDLSLDNLGQVASLTTTAQSPPPSDLNSFIQAGSESTSLADTANIIGTETHDLATESNETLVMKTRSRFFQKEFSKKSVLRERQILGTWGQKKDRYNRHDADKKEIVQKPLSSVKCVFSKQAERSQKKRRLENEMRQNYEEYLRKRLRENFKDKGDTKLKHSTSNWERTSPDVKHIKNTRSELMFLNQRTTADVNNKKKTESEYVGPLKTTDSPDVSGLISTGSEILLNEKLTVKAIKNKDDTNRSDLAINERGEIDKEQSDEAVSVDAREEKSGKEFAVQVTSEGRIKYEWFTDKVLPLIQGTPFESLSMRLINETEKVVERNVPLKYTIPSSCQFYQPPEAQPVYLSQVLTALGFKKRKRNDRTYWTDRESGGESTGSSDSELGQGLVNRREPLPGNVKLAGPLTYLKTKYFPSQVHGLTAEKPQEIKLELQSQEIVPEFKTKKTEQESKEASPTEARSKIFHKKYSREGKLRERKALGTWGKMPCKSTEKDASELAAGVCKGFSHMKRVYAKHADKTGERQQEERYHRRQDLSCKIGHTNVKDRPVSETHENGLEDQTKVCPDKKVVIDYEKEINNTSERERIANDKVERRSENKTQTHAGKIDNVVEIFSAIAQEEIDVDLPKVSDGARKGVSIRDSVIQLLQGTALETVSKKLLNEAEQFGERNVPLQFEIPSSSLMRMLPEAAPIYLPRDSKDKVMSLLGLEQKVSEQELHKDSTDDKNVERMPSHISRRHEELHTRGSRGSELVELSVSRRNQDQIVRKSSPRLSYQDFRNSIANASLTDQVLHDLKSRTSLLRNSMERLQKEMRELQSDSHVLWTEEREHMEGDNDRMYDESKTDGEHDEWQRIEIDKDADHENRTGQTDTLWERQTDSRQSLRMRNSIAKASLTDQVHYDLKSRTSLLRNSSLQKEMRELQSDSHVLWTEEREHKERDNNRKYDESKTDGEHDEWQRMEIDKDADHENRTGQTDTLWERQTKSRQSLRMVSKSRDLIFQEGSSDEPSLKQAVGKGAPMKSSGSTMKMVTIREENMEASENIQEPLIDHDMNLTELLSKPIDDCAGYLAMKTLDSFVNLAGRNIPLQFEVRKQEFLEMPSSAKPMFLPRKLVESVLHLLGLSRKEVTEKPPPVREIPRAQSKEILEVEEDTMKPTMLPIELSEVSFVSNDNKHNFRLYMPRTAVECHRELTFYCPEIPLQRVSRVKARRAKKCYQQIGGRDNGAVQSRRSRSHFRSSLHRSDDDLSGRKKRTRSGCGAWSKGELGTSANFFRSWNFYREHMFRKRITLKNILSECKKSKGWKQSEDMGRGDKITTEDSNIPSHTDDFQETQQAKVNSDLNHKCQDFASYKIDNVLAKSFDSPLCMPIHGGCNRCPGVISGSADSRHGPERLSAYGQTVKDNGVKLEDGPEAHGDYVNNLIQDPSHILSHGVRNDHTSGQRLGSFYPSNYHNTENVSFASSASVPVKSEPHYNDICHQHGTRCNDVPCHWQSNRDSRKTFLFEHTASSGLSSKHSIHDNNPTSSRGTGSRYEQKTYDKQDSHSPYHSVLKTRTSHYGDRSSKYIPNVYPSTLLTTWKF